MKTLTIKLVITDGNYLELKARAKEWEKENGYFYQDSEEASLFADYLLIDNPLDFEETPTLEESL